MSETNTSSFDTASLATTTTTTNNRQDHQDTDSPEALVRKDNATVGIFRTLVLLFLACAAFATSAVVYAYLSKAEEQDYEEAFEGIASRIIDSLEAQLRAKLWTGQTIASGTALLLSGNETSNYFLSVSRMFALTMELRLQVGASIAAYSPLLRGDKERLAFEANFGGKPEVLGPSPVCNVCGLTQTARNPRAVLELPGHSFVPCFIVEMGARTGLIEPHVCDNVLDHFEDACGCGPIPQDAFVPERGFNRSEVLYTLDTASPFATVPYGQEVYHPIAQSAQSFLVAAPAMYDQMTQPERAEAIQHMIGSNLPIFSSSFDRKGPYYDIFVQNLEPENNPGVVLYSPVLHEETRALIGSIATEFEWRRFDQGVFPERSHLVDLVVENTCGQIMTFKPRSKAGYFNLDFVGFEDLHNTGFSEKVVSTSYENFFGLLNSVAVANPDADLNSVCKYRFHVYSTQELYDEFNSSQPITFALLAGAIFVFCSIVFLMFNRIVSIRQAKVMASARRTNDIVMSLFPENVRDRLYQQAQKKAMGGKQTTQHTMNNFLDSEDNTSNKTLLDSEPIADLFPSTTVMFLDIVNFTAWCSERDPSQVFRLLESLYNAFDEVGETLGVFKVETIGDSYVAACGLPEYRENHAVVMAKFAHVCLKRMKRVVAQLEVTLGPSTGELRARVGLHSGPVTAGVLRGEKARFQLFGDTVNMAARMESSSISHCIHASEATAKLLIAAKRGSWVTAREGTVAVKGKGELQTYWIALGTKKGGPDTSSVGDDFSTGTDDSGSEMDGPMGRNYRLVEWNVEVLTSLLQRLIQSRGDGSTIRTLEETSIIKATEDILKQPPTKEHMIIDEMTQILNIPAFKAPTRSNISVTEVVREQLRQFVISVASLYRDVPFHNFEHASHVSMSAGKLIKRIVNPGDIDYHDNEEAVAKEIYDLTYGISGDPLLHFSVVFAALIHDVDHTGLTNSELTKEEKSVALAYKNKSVAEQNSVDVAWMILMNDQFKELRACIYTTRAELLQFRHLVVNAVMATDIADKNLKSLREARWDAAFSDKESLPLDRKSINRKATIVFEYIIQAADISHTMQHWHTYQKFNARLFEERYVAWLSGHLPKEPSLGWYGGELWFFDNYIIPMAEKLNRCGVFGVSYHESLTYALENRREWEVKGNDIVQRMLADMQSKYAGEKPVALQAVE